MTAAPQTVAGQDPWAPIPARVLSRRAEIGDTWTLEIAPQVPLAPFAPGQFNMLWLFGAGEAAISYSGGATLAGGSGDTAGAGPIRHTIRAVGKVSAGLAALDEGAVLGVRGPFGVGWPMAEAEGGDVVVVAGGLGLAPLRPAILHLMHHRARYGRIALAFGMRSPDAILYRREIEDWRRRLDLDIAVTLDHAGPDWHGTVGVVPALIARLGFDPARTLAMVCGPEVMMRFTVEALLRRGVAPQAVYLSMERHMKCAVGLCGRCQFGPELICRDGPVFRYDRIAPYLILREI